jgi:hypothetical protein
LKVNLVRPIATAGKDACLRAFLAAEGIPYRE